MGKEIKNVPIVFSGHFLLEWTAGIGFPDKARAIRFKKNYCFLFLIFIFKNSVASENAIAKYK